MTQPPSKKSEEDSPLNVPVQEPASDGFPAEKDVSKAPPGTDQAQEDSPTDKAAKKE